MFAERNVAILIVACSAKQSSADWLASSLRPRNDGGGIAPAPPPQRLGSRLRQPVHGPVERDLSRAAAGVHHAWCSDSGDGARRDRRGRRSDRQFRQAVLRPAVGPQPEAQAVGDGRLRPRRVVQAAVPARGQRAGGDGRALRRPHRQGHPRQPARRDARRRDAARDPRPRLRAAGRRSTPSARCSRRWWRSG